MKDFAALAALAIVTETAIATETETATDTAPLASVKPVEIALAYAAHEESAASLSLVAWTMAALDLRCGWSGKASPDMKTAIKVLRERHGYMRDADGETLLDEKGNKRKRQAIFNRLALVEKVALFMSKHAENMVQTLHLSAITGDRDAMQEAVSGIAFDLVTRAEGDSLDHIAFYLDNEKSKRAALAETAKSDEQKAQEAADKMHADRVAADKAADKAKEQEAVKVKLLTFHDIMRALSAIEMDMAQLEALAMFAAQGMGELKEAAQAAQEARDALDVQAAQEARDALDAKEVHKAA